METKPGWKTSEFWICLLVVLVALVLPAAGVLPEGSVLAKVGGMVVSVLAALGYTLARARVKLGIGE